MNAISKCIAAAALLAGGLVATVAASAEIVLQSTLTRGFVREDGGVLVANGNQRSALRLEVVRLQGNRVALRAPDGTYVRAGVGRVTQLSTGSPHIRGWETFEMSSRPDNRIALRSMQNGRFVAANRLGVLTATALQAGSATEFRMAGPGRPGENPRPPQDDRPPRFDWTGDWSFLRVAGENGELSRPPREARIQFSVGRDMRVAMSVGCNRIGAQLRVEGRDRAEFGEAFATKMLCQGRIGRYERALLDALGQVRRYEYREGQVAFLDRRGRTVIQIGR